MEVYDLTQTYKNGMTSYSEEESFKKENLYNVKVDGYNVSSLYLSTHTGTHIDVPKHIFEDGYTLDDFDTKEFIGNAYIIDCRHLSVIDLEVLEKYKDNILKCDYLILKTGWERYFNSEKYFLDYPALTCEASNFLGNIKSLTGIGTDCISIDSEKNEELYNHKNLLSKNKIIIENLCNLDVLDNSFEIIIAPLKIAEGDGAPARVYSIKR
ncbi:cyclase family protein [Clostridium baratii]|uniref:cyclase family protein n=1 Tax=Clostridium baratii TaxID=1561 RepID=UPI003D3498B5